MTVVDWRSIIGWWKLRNFFSAEIAEAQSFLQMTTL